MIERLFRIWVVLMLLLVTGCRTTSPVPKLAENADFHVAQARELMAQENLTHALAHLKKAQGLKPDMPGIKEEISNVETRLKNDANQHYLKGVESEKHGHYKKAETLFKKATALWSGHVQAKKAAATYRDCRNLPGIDHPVQPGDTISKLAVYYYDDYGKLNLIGRTNRLLDSSNLKLGQLIKIPAAKDVSLDQLKAKRRQYLTAGKPADLKTGTQSSKSTHNSTGEADSTKSTDNTTPDSGSCSSTTEQADKPKEKEIPLQEEEPVTAPIVTADSKPIHQIPENSPENPDLVQSDPPTPDKEMETTPDIKALDDYQWDKKITWGMTLRQLNRIFQGNIKEKSRQKGSFLAYFDLLSTAHAKENALAHYYLDDPIMLDSCHYSPLFTMNADKSLIQVTLTSTNRQCACHESVKEKLGLIYGEPLENADRSYGRVKDYSTTWQTKDTIIIKNFSSTALGSSCNIVFKKRTSEK